MAKIDWGKDRDRIRIRGVVPKSITPRWPLSGKYWGKPVTYVWMVDREACLRLLQETPDNYKGPERYLQLARTAIQSLLERSKT